MVQLAATNTILQTVVDEPLRGRVMGFYAMSFFGGAPLGSLVGGVIAYWLGPAAAIAIGGVACLLAVYGPTSRCRSRDLGRRSSIATKRTDPSLDRTFTGNDD